MHMRIKESGDHALAVCVNQPRVAIFQAEDLGISAN
jgi:hypothetical protein